MSDVPAASPLDRLSSPAPPGRFLSNGRYTVLITSAGTGFSTVGACRLNVWTGDRIEDHEGFFVYIRDVESGRTWSAGDQPVRSPAEQYACTWRAGAFEISRTDDGITTRTGICVPYDDPLELRRISLVNRGERPRRIELTSFIEVCLGSPASHAAHPAFSKLFVQTERTPEGLLATRRPRAHGESHPCMFHAMIEEGERSEEELEYETDRARFMGRRGSFADPRAIRTGDRLSGTTGSVLDPILSLRRVFSLHPGATATATFVLGAAADRAAALDLIHRVGDGRVEDRFDAARERESRSLRALGLNDAEGEYAQDLASAILYAHPFLRCPPSVLEQARGSTEDLERLGVSWRRPFVVLHAERPAGGHLLRTLLKIHGYWRSLPLEIDLLVMCRDPARIRAETGETTDDSIKIAAVADLSPARRAWIDTAARLVVEDRLPDLGSIEAARSGS